MENIVGNLHVNDNLSSIFASSRWLYPPEGEDQFIAGDLGVYAWPNKTLEDTTWKRIGSNPGTYTYDGDEQHPYKWTFAQFNYGLVYDIQTGKVFNNNGVELAQLEPKPDGKYPNPATEDLGSFTYEAINLVFQSTSPAKTASIPMMQSMSQSAYDQLSHKDPNTLYIITSEN